MKTYEYRGFDQSGRAAQGMIEALSPKDAREKLANQGILPKKLAPAGQKGARMILKRNRPFHAGMRAGNHVGQGAVFFKPSELYKDIFGFL